MTEINNRIEKVAEYLYKRFTVDGAKSMPNWQNVREVVRNRFLMEARQICQLFPQLLPGIECPECGGKGSWVKEDDACNAVGDPCDKCNGTGRVPQPLDDKELEKAIYTIIRQDIVGHSRTAKLSKQVSALLQLKIEEARRQERERISKLLDDMSMICPEADQCSACEEFRQVLKE